MTRSRSTTRTGMTLLEVIAVMAVMLILGAILLPAIGAVRGDTRQKAAADTIAARVADGRVMAMEQGRPFQLAVHTDGRRLRLSPYAADTMADGADAVEDTLPDAVSAVVVPDATGVAPAPDDAGWVAVATFQADGCCREDNVLVEVAEAGLTPVYVHLRGITGVVTVRTGDPSTGGV